MGRHKENYTKEEALKIYKNMRKLFVMEFLNLYNKSPVNTRKMICENFEKDEIFGINKMVETLEKLF